MTTSAEGKSLPSPSPSPPGRAMSLIDYFFAFLSSLKLAIPLILLIAGLCIIGTVVVQTPLAEPGQIEKTYLPATVKLFNYLGFFDVFHSMWFTTILALLGLNLIFCTIDIFPRTAEFIKRPKLDASEHYIQGQQCKANFEHQGDEADMNRRIEQVLRVEGLRPVYTTYPDRGVFFAQAGLWWRFTVYLIHLSLLVIFTGGIMTSKLGYSGFVPLVEGERTDKFLRKTANGEEQQPFGFDIQCRYTTIEPRTDMPISWDPLNKDDIKSVGKVHRWTSHMTIFENGQEAFQYGIMVNDPLNYRGFKIYQASFGITADYKKLQLMAKKDGAPDSEAVKFEVGPQETVPVPGSDLTVTVKKFIPDPALDPKTGQPASRSRSFFDPDYEAAVALLELKKPDGTTYEKYALYHPESPWAIVDRRGGNNEVALALAKVEPKYYTGLQVAHSPGYATFVVGGTMLLLALVLRFYFAHRRFWVTVKKNAESFQIYIGANTSRHKVTLEKKFNRIVSGVQSALGA